jgi:hypothetical protein
VIHNEIENATKDLAVKELQRCCSGGLDSLPMKYWIQNDHSAGSRLRIFWAVVHTINREMSEHDYTT